MIGVDYGTKLIKWFNGREFGFGFPRGRSFTIGLSSAKTLVKETTFPLCKGKELKKLILNELTADLGVEPSKISVAFCPVGRVKKGCRVIVFVQKREEIESIEKGVRENSIVTLDLIGTLSTVSIKYPQDELNIIDVGESKVSLLKIKEGKLEGVEILRGGLNREGVIDELLDKLEPNKRTLLIGGGAFNTDLRDRLKGHDVEVPEFEPFGKETPLFFNAFGLHFFKKSPCKAAFSQPSLLPSELIGNNRELLIKVGATLALSIALVTAGETLELLRAKKEYTYTKEKVNELLSKVIGERVLLPEAQIEQKLKELKELKNLLKAGKPSTLNYLSAISRSLVKGVKILEVNGSCSSEQFTLVGKALSGKSLNEFIKNLKGKFEKVSISLSKKGKFKIVVWRLKVGA